MMVTLGLADFLGCDMQGPSRYDEKSIPEKRLPQLVAWRLTFIGFPAVSPCLTAPRASRLLQQAAACRSSHSGMPTDGSELLLSKNRKSVYWILVEYEER